MASPDLPAPQTAAQPSKKLYKGPWTGEEEAALLESVQELGTNDWIGVGDALVDDEYKRRSLSAYKSRYTKLKKADKAAGAFTTLLLFSLTSFPSAAVGVEATTSGENEAVQPSADTSTDPITLPNLLSTLEALQASPRTQAYKPYPPSAGAPPPSVPAEHSSAPSTKRTCPLLQARSASSISIYSGPFSPFPSRIPSANRAPSLLPLPFSAFLVGSRPHYHHLQPSQICSSSPPRSADEHSALSARLPFAELCAGHSGIAGGGS